VSLPAFLAHSGLTPAVAAAAAALLVAAVFLVYAFSHAAFRASGLLVVSGIIMGLLVPAGWFVTGFLGNDPFTPSPVASLTFIAPLADSLQYMMLSTGSTLNFGIVVMAGVLLGSFMTAVATRRFELEGYKSHSHMLRSIGGAAMMGIGGVMAFGCSIGQGLTGLSTLALPSAIAVVGILIGATVGLRSPARVPAMASA
jgi:hypothetical protein